MRQLTEKNNKLELEIITGKTFSHKKLKEKPSKFQYFTAEKFDVLFNCLLSYSHIINYPECKGSGIKALDYPTELLSVMTVCHHGLHNGVIVYMLNVGESTTQKIFVAWILFMEAIFSRINLRPDNGFLAYSIPEIFMKTVHGLTDIFIDCTELNLQQLSNYDLSTLTFSNYKNTNTGKALIGIPPNGMGLFSEIW